MDQSKPAGPFAVAKGLPGVPDEMAYQRWVEAQVEAYGPVGPFGFSHRTLANLRKMENRPVEVEVEEGVLTCPRCGCKQVQVIQKQVRSADEPMTAFAKCTSCSKSWKQ